MGGSRRVSRQIRVWGVPIGGGASVSVQSMTKTDTRDVEATVTEIRRLEAAGCDLVRVAVPDEAAAAAVSSIVAQARIPVIADIHYRQDLAVAALERGAAAVRLNPGNLKDEWRIKRVVDCAKQHRAPIRIGVNAGSVDAVHQTGQPREEKGTEALAEKLVERALRYVRMFEAWGFYAIKISCKVSSVRDTVAAYRRMAQVCDYPLHLGVTEAGLPRDGAVKSAMGIGALLLEGIGDTVRVSLTGDPVQEVEVGQQILQFLGLRDFGPEIIACPSCGRADVDLIRLVETAYDRFRAMGATFRSLRGVTIALMGCEVNGPGEAKDADLGIAAGRGQGAIFRKGKLLRRVQETEMVEALVEELTRLSAPAPSPVAGVRAGTAP